MGRAGPKVVRDHHLWEGSLHLVGGRLFALAYPAAPVSPKPLGQDLHLRSGGHGGGMDGAKCFSHSGTGEPFVSNSLALHSFHGLERAPLHLEGSTPRSRALTACALGSSLEVTGPFG